jgi:hypothetical protein
MVSMGREESLLSAAQLPILLVSQSEVDRAGAARAQSHLNDVDGFEVGVSPAKHPEDGLFIAAAEDRADAGSFGGLIPHADGGSVSPGSAYLVGERGPEILTGASGNITSNVASRRMLGGSTGNTLYYSIDARGTDPVLTEQRTKAALIAVHSSAISNAVQVNAERIKRTPSSRTAANRRHPGSRRSKVRFGSQRLLSRQCCHFRGTFMASLTG